MVIKFFKKMLGGSKKKGQGGVKEIFCSLVGDTYLKKFKTTAIDSEQKNLDGSDPQEAINKLKIGEKVRLIWDADSTEDTHVVYLLRSGEGDQLSMADCFGRLNVNVATQVIRGVSGGDTMTEARVNKIAGGTRKRPMLSCVLEITTYPAPEKK